MWCIWLIVALAEEPTSPEVAPEPVPAQTAPAAPPPASEAPPADVWAAAVPAEAPAEPAPAEPAPVAATPVAPTPVAPTTAEADVAALAVPVDAAPATAPAFESWSDCIAYGKRVSTWQERFVIGRFDARWRRCERSDDGIVWRDTHAPLLLDPILDPALLLGSAIGLAVDTARLDDDLAGRALAKWGDEDGRIVRPHKPGPYLAPVGKWAEASDGILYASLGIAALPTFTSSGNAKLTDTVVMAEVLLVDYAVARGIGLRTAEPRPYMDKDLRAFSSDDLWTVQEDMRTGNAWTSYPSMHTSVTAASTFGVATLWATRGRPTPWIAVPYTLAVGLTAVQGAARVLSLREDPTDVAVGALTGAAIGVLVPLSHVAIAKVIDPDRIARMKERRGMPATLNVAPAPNGLALQGTW